MRILFLSNFYPPHYIGGYEIGCHDVVQALEKRGHECRVLTSTYKVGKPVREGNVYRYLNAEHFFRGIATRRLLDKEKESGVVVRAGIGRRVGDAIDYLGTVLRAERQNQKALRRVLTEYKPEVVYVWNIRCTSITMLSLFARLNLPCVFYIFDNWLAVWKDDPFYVLASPRSSRFGRLRHATMRMIQRLGLELPDRTFDMTHVQFASNYLKRKAVRAGEPVKHGSIVHWGLNVEDFPLRPAPERPRKLLYVGQIVPAKGTMTAINALARVIREPGLEDATLTLAGGSAAAPWYDQQIRNRVAELGLESRVTFLGHIPRSELPAIYADHDIMIFPSIFEEPFGITILEGMSSGLPVVGTGTGGSGEFMKPEYNALIYFRGDADACARHIIRLMRQPDVYERIRRNGRHTVEVAHNFDHLIDTLECDLMATQPGVEACSPASQENVVVA